eukprot:GHVL01009217.1.p1 GENE.GHVL01009217.1~~GHVL01009217.1.p1  ORF type:complete len:372 (+),score=89.29 GHVL01009217.1:85-1200(+)
MSKGDNEVFDKGKIFVGGLSPEVTEETFRSYFEEFGTVSKVILMYDKLTNRHRGFGFIAFENHSSVEECLKNKDNHKINDKWVEVKRAQTKGSLPPGGHRNQGPSNDHLGGGYYNTRMYGGGGYGGHPHRPSFGPGYDPRGYDDMYPRGGYGMDSRMYGPRGHPGGAGDPRGYGADPRGYGPDPRGYGPDPRGYGAAPAAGDPRGYGAPAAADPRGYGAPPAAAEPRGDGAAAPAAADPRGYGAAAPAAADPREYGAVAPAAAEPRGYGSTAPAAADPRGYGAYDNSYGYGYYGGYYGGYGADSYYPPEGYYGGGYAPYEGDPSRNGHTPSSTVSAAAPTTPASQGYEAASNYGPTRAPYGGSSSNRHTPY